MDIRPNLPIGGVAGTARAQAFGSDRDRGPAAGGVAESNRFGDNSRLNEGTRTEDRDADGRQLLDQQTGQHGSDRQTPPEEPDQAAVNPPRHGPPSTGSEGAQLDLQA